MELENVNIVQGAVPKKCRQLVRDRAEIHQAELIEMWETQNFHEISPLERLMKLVNFSYTEGFCL